VVTLLVKTTRFTRGRLPHWEVERGSYFVTARCHDSLPAEAVDRLRVIANSLNAIAAATPAFQSLQRQYFHTMEKYLDVGRGEAPLRDPRAAGILAREFAAMSDQGAEVVHYTIMPNHWHALITAVDDIDFELHALMRRLKGRTARGINQALGRSGPLWQREWFDRWNRHESEWERCVQYIRQNPVKAGLVRDWREHPWTK